MMINKNTPARQKAVKAHALRNPDYHNIKQRQYRHDNPEWYLLKRCKNSARVRSYEFDLMLEDIYKLTEDMTCSVTGHKLSWHWEGKGSNPWAPSLDRKDNAKGYTLDNVRVVCWIFNLSRNVWDDSIVAEFAQTYTEKIK
jgi:hypothetical protein